MNISTKGRYGIRFMLDLAMQPAGQAVSLKDVAARQAFSEKYLWQVVSRLKAAGMLDVVRGAHGGYRLARPPRAMTVRQILEALEGQIALVGCTSGKKTCSRAATCATNELWHKLNRTLTDAMDAISLEDLADQQRRMVKTPTLNYSI